MDINELLSLAITKGASDLHLSATLPPMLRINGELQRLNLPALSPEAVTILIMQTMSNRQQQEYKKRLEIDFAFAVASLGRFRVNVFKQLRGEAAVFRIIPTTIPSIEKLGLPFILQNIASYPYGLILVTGPAGAGKSTTLASMIDYINKNRKGHIITIEDPIEFVHTSQGCLISQREIHHHSLSFNMALRSALREDPNIILVGELRDLVTMRLALRAAETGHLVLGTLHTSSTMKAIHRIINVFPGKEQNLVRSMLAESLQAVTSQHLRKKTAGGRIAVFEIMICTLAIRNLIREDKIAQMYSSIQTGQHHGMQTIEQHLRQLNEQNLIDSQEKIN